MTWYAPPPPAVAWAFAGVLAVLAVASILLAVFRGRLSPGLARELGERIRTWWVMAALFAAAVLAGTVLSLAFFALVSFLALKEYLSLIPTRRADRRVLAWAYLAIPVQYAWVGMEWYGMFIIFVPVYMFLLLAVRIAFEGITEGFLRAVATLHWGLMVTVFSLSHAAMLLATPAEGNPAAGGTGLLLFLVVLTQANDVFQYLAGKPFGRHRIVPSVSPGKTWEGLAGGVVATTAAAFALAPLLTPFDLLDGALAGLVIALAGFCGDVTMSALKRDLGVKDSGSLLPGHGGILDRVDSLTFSAPLFFHFTIYLYY